MSNLLTDAASQLATRPDEEHFPTLAAMMADAQQQRARCSELRVSDAGVLFVNDGGRVRVEATGVDAVSLSHYSARQVGTLCGVPATVQDKLTPSTRALVLNETFPRDANGHDARRWLVEDHPETGRTLRAVTSASYSRLWDASLLAEVDRWAVGSGWVPATPEINTDEHGTNIKGNTKPALFRSDRDSFAFFMGGRDEDGGAFGGLRPGLMVWNSEVGFKSFGFRRFYFRGMCANFLIWDATAIKTRRARHTKGVQRVARMFSRELERIAQPITTAELDAFATVARVPFIGWKGSDKETRKEAASKLYRMTGSKVSQSQAAQAIDAAIDEERNASPEGSGVFLSAWDVANGLTWTAKRQRWQDGRTQLQEAAGAVLTAAAEGRIR